MALFPLVISPVPLKFTNLANLSKPFKAVLYISSVAFFPVGFTIVKLAGLTVKNVDLQTLNTPSSLTGTPSASCIC